MSYHVGASAGARCRAALRRRRSLRRAVARDKHALRDRALCWRCGRWSTPSAAEPSPPVSRASPAAQRPLVPAGAGARGRVVGRALRGGTGLLSLAQANSLVPALALAAARWWRSIASAARGGTASWCWRSCWRSPAPTSRSSWRAAAGRPAAGAGARRRAPDERARRAAAGARHGALVLGGGGETMRVLLDPLSIVQYARHDLGLDPVTGGWLLAWIPAWLVISLGARLAGLPAAVAALASGRAAAVAAAGFRPFGWPAGLLFRVSPIETGLRERPSTRRSTSSSRAASCSGSSWRWLSSAWRRETRGCWGPPSAPRWPCPAACSFVLEKRAGEPRAIRAEAVRAMRALVAASRPSTWR